MNESPQLTPDELDRLEDALEDLLAGEPPTDPSPAVTERMHAYRRVLELSREALPPVDVPDGLLDRVLDEARRAAALPPSSTETVDASWWDRFRRTYLWPSVALAGTMALVLWVMAPGRGDQVLMHEDRVAAPAAARPLGDAEAKPALDDGAPGSAASAPPAAPETEDAAAAPPGEQPTAEPDAYAPPLPKEEGQAPGVAKGERDQPTATTSPRRAKRRPQSKKSAPKSSTGLDPLDGLGTAKPRSAPAGGRADADDAAEAPASTPPARDDAGMEQVRRGDSHRRAGNCGLARLQYERARKSFDRNVQARALAGLGLCELAEGNEDAGRRQLKRARSLDPSVDGFIRDQSPAPRKNAEQADPG